MKAIITMVLAVLILSGAHHVQAVELSPDSKICMHMLIISKLGSKYYAEDNMKMAARLYALPSTTEDERGILDYVYKGKFGPKKWLASPENRETMSNLVGQACLEELRK